MNLKKFKVAGVTLFLMVAISACGKNFHALPDDPSFEPTPPNKEDSSSLVETTPPISDEDSIAPEENPDAPQVVDATTEEAILRNYDHLDSNRIVPSAALKNAVLYFHENQNSFKNKKVISVLDMSQKSTQKRWYFIDLQSGSVFNLHASHGKGSDSNHDGYAEKFSNASGSNATSLGFYRTGETYTGSNGYSLRLDGLSPTNSNARSRAIVVHGASYVKDANVIQGRSWGCPAVSNENRNRVINLIKGGSLLYIFK